MIYFSSSYVNIKIYKIVISAGPGRNADGGCCHNRHIDRHNHRGPLFHGREQNRARGKYTLWNTLTVIQIARRQL